MISSKVASCGQRSRVDVSQNIVQTQSACAADSNIPNGVMMLREEGFTQDGRRFENKLQ
ncbi:MULTISPECIES: hypothetical protein [Leptolyngbya]|uniref:hypothetical protein n=1 Tax=Leptolyngbya TaxID=47251 RepID=UPI0003709CFE|nr:MULTISPECIES: hypothetical protein [Leptolyngbya]MBD2371146.1 hypothetical protein [Leptolyngbya sp. FACHB-161]MBD2377614.1 hypothetical protein [Leptolyngbya sp. FACHB-238]MBD2402056.1 hypothetical protein [Leptolyngbya sp. FACHB-239]MBD2408575.1 hypothetical protein [Leptolyngbya sp. FACHB-402]ULP33799.1 hypothetical protein MCP04_32000 [Leptolyngbya boryana IU 594]